MTKITYVKCPRCDLNYMDSRLEMCDICKAELNLEPGNFIDDEDDIKELCPICKNNYVEDGEEMCAACAEELEAKNARESEEDEGWKDFIDEPIEEDDADDDEMEIPLEEIQDE